MYTNPWYVISLIGSPSLWAGIAGILFVIYILFRCAKPGSERTRRLKSFLIILIPSLAIGFLLIVSMKATLDTERICTPCPGEGCNPYCPEDASFPSGHAAAIFTGFTSFFVIIREKRFLLLYIVPALVGISRLMLGVHTWYDILAGALIGIAIPVLVFEYDKWVFGEFR